MKAYSIFDDFTTEAQEILVSAGIELTVHPKGTPRPDPVQMKKIFEDHDCIIIGTSQKIREDMFENINSSRIIATASVGLDHIRIPENKKHLVTVINTPKANAQSVAEYTIGCALSCIKRLQEGNSLYKKGKNNKALFRKPEDMSGKIIGVIGAGNISTKIMEYAGLLGMNIICWTRNPDHHKELKERGVQFKGLEDLVREADVISVNLPDNDGTKGLVTKEYIDAMKDSAVFVSVSREQTVDIPALFRKAEEHPGFYVCLDLDVSERIVNLIPPIPNVMVTPHIAGGTVETRKRMFKEVAEKTAALVNHS